jgi:four helix bundle protein
VAPKCTIVFLVRSQLRVLDASRLVADEINVLLSRHRDRLIQPNQLERAVSSITANIREAYGRRPGPERSQFLRFARGSAEEAEEHLRSNMAAKRIDERCYWRNHHRLRVIVRMLNALMREIVAAGTP